MISGFVLLDKESGISSHRAVRDVARLFDKAKAGHAGTLDPLATGMLPVLLGEATRFSDIGLGADKSYEVCLDLSFQTDTLDAEGEVTQRFDCMPEAAAITAAVARLNGEQEQMPPIYSAISVGGKRAYQLARSGQDVSLPSRRITVHEISLLDIAPPVLRLFVRCSKGTYIRSLARDLGKSLSVGGCVIELRRTGIGNWTAESMVHLETLELEDTRAVQPLSRWLGEMPTLELELDLAKRFLFGQRLPMPADMPMDERSYRVSCGELLLGTAHISAGCHGTPVLRPHRTLPSARSLLIGA
ncbi:MAG: tRNA pseudouridine(55) synthase TruB [Mariprofundaceae bacterium]